MPFPSGLSPVELPEHATHVGPIGVLADIHGNALALEAVIADAATIGVQQWIVLGDVVAMGPNPSEVVERLHHLNPIVSIRGNTDRYVMQGSQPKPSLTEVMADPSRMSELVSAAESFAWTRGYLAATDTIGLLDHYVPSARFTLPDGTRVLALHASLRSDEGRGISPDVTEPEMAHLIPNPDADLVIGGHTHRRADTMFGRVRYLNPGSVSNSPARGNAALYSVIHAEPLSHRVEYRTVGYDASSVVAQILRSAMPGAVELVGRYFASDPAYQRVASVSPEPALA